MPDRVEWEPMLGLAVSSFRLGMLALANETLGRIIEALSQELGRPERAAAAPALMAVLPQMLAAQSRGDALYLADLLQYELAPHLIGHSG